MLTTSRKTALSHVELRNQCAGTYYKHEDRGFNQHKAETIRPSTNTCSQHKKLENESIYRTGVRWVWFYNLSNVQFVLWLYTHKTSLITFIHVYNLFVIFIYVCICTYYTYTSLCSNYDSLLKYSLIHQRRVISWTYSGFFF